jgi:sterol desaturase/sphingolipid hydroxylase (fatty acid hydroxylase superfamily)
MPDGTARLAALAALVVTLALAELLIAARPHRRERWLANLGLGAFGAGLGFALSAVFPIGAALWAESKGIGLFRWLGLSEWLALPLTILLMDLAVYWQHRWMHASTLLWRLHRLHHRDTAMDLTTGVRFHPGEIAVSGLYKAALIVALGASPWAALAFETWLAAASLWEHANLRFPPVLDRRLRYMIVTPAMHEVHHGCRRADIDCNYGFSTSLWDRLFGSYRESSTSERLGCE